MSPGDFTLQDWNNLNRDCDLVTEVSTYGLRLSVVADYDMPDWASNRMRNLMRRAVELGLDELEVDRDNPRVADADDPSWEEYVEKHTTLNLGGDATIRLVRYVSATTLHSEVSFGRVIYPVDRDLLAEIALEHALAGIDVTHPAYINGLKKIASSEFYDGVFKAALYFESQKKEQQ